MDYVPIEARGLSKTFAHSPVLRRVNLKVDRGEGALIVGRNGSGKSTLVRILAGLSSLSAGEALLFGHPSHNLRPDDRRRIGLITHQSFLYPRLTARENLEFYSELYLIEHRANRVAEAFERVGLTSVADERVSTFSRGMEQRLTLARATLAEPDVLLMDEPFAALDVDGFEMALGLIQAAVNRGCAVVMTAHEHFQFERLNFSGYLLERGRLRAPDDYGKLEKVPKLSAVIG